MGTEADDFDDVLSRARAGDETAFLRLWDHLHPRLLRYLRVLGCDEADDVASETWLQAIRDLSRDCGILLAGCDGAALELACDDVLVLTDGVLLAPDDVAPMR